MQHAESRSICIHPIVATTRAAHAGYHGLIAASVTIMNHNIPRILIRHAILDATRANVQCICALDQRALHLALHGDPWYRKRLIVIFFCGCPVATIVMVNGRQQMIVHNFGIDRKMFPIGFSVCQCFDPRRESIMPSNFAQSHQLISRDKHIHGSIRTKKEEEQKCCVSRRKRKHGVIF